MVDLDGLHVEVSTDRLVVPHALGVLVGLELGISFSNLMDLVLFSETFDPVAENVVVAGTTERVGFCELVLVIDNEIHDRHELGISDGLRNRDSAISRPLDVADEAAVSVLVENAIVKAEGCARLSFDLVIIDNHDLWSFC